MTMISTGRRTSKAGKAGMMRRWWAGAAGAVIAAVGMLLLPVSAQAGLSACSTSGIDACCKITTPGSYTVNNDLPSAGGTCIKILVSGVTLDGNGHAMTGSGTGAGIRMRPAAAGDIVYDFADISGFHKGIVDQAPGSVIASTGTAGVVEDSVGDGIVIQASRIYLENIHSDNNHGNGVVVEPLAPATVVSNVYIDKTESSNNTGAGFVLQSLSTFTARLSHAASNGTDGFDLTNSINAIFTDGYSFQNVGDGMKIVGGHDDIVRAESLGAIYEGNHADGLEIRRSVLDTVDDSAMDHNAGEGLLIAKGKSENITSDESAYNAETGVHLKKTTSSRVEELESYNNGGAGIWLQASRAISVQHLIATYNSKSGVYIGCSPAQEPDGTTCASLGLASSDKNLVFNNLNRYNDIGIGIDTGNHKNRVLNNQTSSNSTYDLEDWASACDSNVWMFNTFTIVSPASCIH